MSLEYKNEFFKTLDTDKQEEFKILFDEDANDLDKWKECFKKFVKLQKDNDVINFTGVYFSENYDNTENDFIFQIFEKNEILEKEKNEQNKKSFTIKKKLDFSNATFDKRIEFIRTTFELGVIFEGTIFNDNTNFTECRFKEKTNFEGAKFQKEVVFKEAIFYKEALFYRAYFESYSNFEKVKFKQKSDFENIIANGYFYFHEVAIHKLNLKGAYFSKPNFLALTNIDEIEIKKDNFENKETVRILKDIFEKENNFSESNIYYPIEQEFLIDLLKNEKTSFPNKKLNLLSLYIHKYVSNFGTDWLRVLLVMIIFGFGVGIIYQILPFEHKFIGKCPNFTICNYMFFGFLIIYLLYINNKKYNLFKNYGKRYLFLLFFSMFYFFIFISLILDINILSYFKEQIKNIMNVSNHIIQLINPLNIFSSDFFFNNNKCYFEHINYFSEISIIGVLVKAITLALIYQFIISFRNSTRRK